ncbi:hypothetical protein [Vibrio maritimus]|uniref:hypothetical protein n=1 Tax=Vibrio maritimus TaxID=990268 RepID=UPI003736212A
MLEGIEQQLSQVQSELESISDQLSPVRACDSSLQTELGHTVFRSVPIRGLFVGSQTDGVYEICSNLGPTKQVLDASFWNEERKHNIGFAKLHFARSDGNPSFALTVYQGIDIAVATINPSAILGWWVQHIPYQTYRVLHFSNSEQPLLEQGSLAQSQYKTTKTSERFPISISVYKDTSLFTQGMVTFAIRLLCAFGVVVILVMALGIRRRRQHAHGVSEVQ